MIITESAPERKKGAIKMRGDYQTQMYCVSETNAEMFELKMNEILKGIKNPDIRMDPARSYTAYIFYQIQYDIPETITEALEMVEGSRHYCGECPGCLFSDDKRKKWQFCQVHNKKVHEDSPVCIEFYKIRDGANLLINSENEHN